MEPQQPPLPRPPGDSENLRRLRDEAVERVKMEERMRTQPAPAYGGPPPPLFPRLRLPLPPPPRRWALRGILMLIAGALAAIAAALWGYRLISLPAYGGPPVPQPKPPAGPPQ